MAGDSSSHDALVIPDYEIIDPFERLGSILDKNGGALARLHSDIESLGYEIIGPFLAVAATSTGAAQSQHMKLRVRQILISIDVAAQVALVLGAARYPFQVGPGVTAITWPTVIERATDMSFTSSVAATMCCYLVGKPE